jgi:hypothetical protein
MPRILIRFATDKSFADDCNNPFPRGLQSREIPTHNTTSCPADRPTTLQSSPNKSSRRISGLYHGIHQIDKRYPQKGGPVQNEINSGPNPELTLLHQPTHRTRAGPTRCVLAEKSRYYAFLNCIDINSLLRGYRTQDPRY